MKWKKYTIETTQEAEEAVTAMLCQLGITDVEIEDKKPFTEEDKKKMYIDILPDPEEDDGRADITFYLEISSEEQNAFAEQEATSPCSVKGEENILDVIRRGLEERRQYLNMGSCVIREEVTEDEDWINNWKQYFRPFYVDDILIKPTWEELPEQKDYSMYIDIDPGIAFGTGMHETTRLCIRQLRKYVDNDTKLLDVGCGSGILFILGQKLGAREAVAIDIDPNATGAARENAQVNQIDDSTYTIYTGNILEDKEMQDKINLPCYDIVVANILADVIIPLQDIIGPCMKPGAKFIASGIINTKEEEVKKAIESNPALEILEITRDGDWVSITAGRI